MSCLFFDFQVIFFMVHLFCVIGIFYSLDLYNGVRWINIVCPTGNIVLVAGAVYLLYYAVGESEIEYIRCSLYTIQQRVFVYTTPYVDRLLWN